MTLGQTPYVDIDPFEMSAYLKDGYRIAQPINCPDELYVDLQSALTQIQTHYKYKYVLFFLLIDCWKTKMLNERNKQVEDVILSFDKFWQKNLSLFDIFYL